VEPYRARRADALIDIGERLRMTGLIFNFYQLRILANDCRGTSGGDRRQVPAGGVVENAVVTGHQ
jgi:hypothetical protein